MHIHLSGIGGIGMSALARYFLSFDCIVSGSDSVESKLTESLKKEGVLWIDASCVFAETVDIFIYSEALLEEDIQRVYAKEKNIKTFSYFQYLGAISKEYQTIAVCGTNGKSTTTSMLGHALVKTNQNPLVIVGTQVKEFAGKNIVLSKENTSTQSLFVVESCEYRHSFLSLQPFGVVFTNCEYDHMDYYKSEETYFDAFKTFIESIPDEGFLIANFDDANVKKLSKYASCKVIPVSFTQSQIFQSLELPGDHNRMNAIMAYEAAKYIISYRNTKGNNDKFLSLQHSLEHFSGTERRFDILKCSHNYTVIDDYAHHPTAIAVTLKALADFAKGRNVIIVFQAHQYSRTRELFVDFIDVFVSGIPSSLVLKKLFIPDIYEARDTEQDKVLVSAEKLVKEIQKQGGDAEYSGNYDTTIQKTKKILQNDDILFTMGAGPVNTVAEFFL
jgi:UDP-N-acetylmuramate--alanine ligase